MGEIISPNGARGKAPAFLEKNMQYDLIVIGSGSGGRQAALAAAGGGLKTAVVESGFPGGACVNSGCIPTKFLLGSSALLPFIETQKRYGVIEGNLELNLEKLQGRKDAYLKGMRQSVQKSLESAGVDFLPGEAAFTSANSLGVKKSGEITEHQFKYCVVASGSTPASFPGVKPDGAAVLGSSAAMNLKQAPESMVVIGSGPIGLELSEFFSRFGTKITLIESRERLLANEDDDIGLSMQNYLTRAGREIIFGKRAENVSTVNGRALLKFTDGSEIEAEKALVAVGRKPDATRLQVEAAGLETCGPGWLKVDGKLRAAPHIYAVGDINGRKLLAGAAAHQGEYAAQHILAALKGEELEDYADSMLPACIYGHMESMRSGPNLADLRKECPGQTITVSTAQLVSNPITQSYGVTHGFIKALWANGRLRSIAAIGHGVSGMTMLAHRLVSQQCTCPEAASLCAAHPTLDEALKAALLAPHSAV